MKRNKFAIITAIILGSIALWFYIHNGKGTINESFRNFAVADITTVNKIILKKNNTTIKLERQTSGAWTVNEKYAVNGNALKSLLYAMKNIDVKEPIGKNAQDSIVKDLISNGVQCEIYQNDELTKAYYIGKQTTNNSGTSMILMDIETMHPSEKAFVTYIPGVENNLAANYFIEERGWRDHTVFKYNPSDIKSIKMEAPLDPEGGYEISLKGNNNYQVTILSTKQVLNNLDTSAVKQYLSYFEQLNFEKFVSDWNPIQMDSLLKSTPLKILTVTDNTNKINKVQFYPLKKTNNNTLAQNGKPLKFDPERMIALLDNGKDIVIVKFYEFGKVMPPANYFQKKYIKST